LISLVVLVALLGGLAMASVAGGRRTASSFSTYLASTNPSTLDVFSRYIIPSLGVTTGYDAALAAKIARLPLVERATSAVVFDANINISGITGLHPNALPAEAPPTFIGSPDGELTSVDRLTLVGGRMFDPTSTDQAVINAQAAREGGLHVGSVIGIPIYTDAQLLSSAASLPRYLTVKVVGIVVASWNVVESDLDSLDASAMIFSPALTRELDRHYANGTETFLQVRGGDRNAKQVLREFDRIDPEASELPVQLTSQILPVAQQTLSPEAVALEIFGAIAAVAALLIGALMIGRILRLGVDELATLRALGASRTVLVGDQLVGVVLAVVAGAALSVVVAFGLSPLSPLGPVRPVYPHPGLSFDGTVLGLGALVVIVVLGALALVVARRNVRRLTTRREGFEGRRESRLLSWAKASGLPISAVTGLRFVVRSDRGRDSTPVRSALLGTILAVTVLAGTVTFGASLDSLISHPRLYGWNWDLAMLSGFAADEDLPAPQVARLLDADHDVAAWSGANVANAQLDGQHVGILVQAPRAKVAPPLLSGHGVDATNQIVLGSATMRSLHKRLGETVTLESHGVRSKPLVIVGTIAVPAITGGGIGDGADVATDAVPAQLLNLQSSSIPGPNVVFVRVRSGVSVAAARASLQEIDKQINAIPAAAGTAGGVVTVLRPAEIVNFRSMGTIPAVLAAVLASGSVAALGLTLTASIRRRRRELALLKALGFTQRQLALSVAWQASGAAFVGCVFGLPIGVAVGRELWLLFARSVNAVPQATVPALTLTLVGLGAFVFSNLVAAIPERVAARTPAALVLRSE
jgi:ABC-type antimicrobial peptide transport system permease subunit